MNTDFPFFCFPYPCSSVSTCGSSILSHIRSINDNPSPEEVERTLTDISLLLDYDDLGKAFYQRLLCPTGLKLIDFENFERSYEKHIMRYPQLFATKAIEAISQNSQLLKNEEFAERELLRLAITQFNKTQDFGFDTASLKDINKTILKEYLDEALSNPDRPLTEKE